MRFSGLERATQARIVLLFLLFAGAAPILLAVGAVESDADRAERAYAAATIAERNGDLSEVRNQLDLAVALDPHNIEYIVSRGWMFMRRRLVDAAVEDFRRAIEIEPSGRS